MTLDQLSPGDTTTIVALAGDANLVQRLYELGFYEGEVIEVVAFAPLGDPVEVRVGASRMSLRKREAAAITVESCH